MKINNQIVTTYDLEKETSYLLALNPKLKEMSENDLLKLAKKSMIKELIRKSEILKYKDLNLKNSQINNVLKNIIQNLDFSDQSQFEDYLKNYNITIDDIRKKIEIENEWKNLIYSKYSKSVKIDKNDLINKIERLNIEKFFVEYNLSEIVFVNDQNISIDEQSKKILESININGFENSANLYSISDSSRVGGKIDGLKRIVIIEINRELENLKKLYSSQSKLVIIF